MNPAPPVSNDRHAKDRRGVGPNSDLKHELIAEATSSLLATHAVKSKGRGLIIDMTAGDAQGVTRRQLAMFGDNLSVPTAQLAVDLGARYRVDVVLCEKNRAKLCALRAAFPTTKILTNYKLSLDFLSGVDWAVVLCDPNGPSDSHNGVSEMAEIARLVSRSDFVVTFNSGGQGRHASLTATGAGASPLARVRASYEAREKYQWMQNPYEWAKRLGKRHVAESLGHIKNPAFRARVLIISNYLPNCVGKGRFRRVV